MPRPPAEAQPDGRIVLRDGRDVSEQFALGAARSLERVRESGASVAILKAHSPSCGVGQVYGPARSPGACARATGLPRACSWMPG